MAAAKVAQKRKPRLTKNGKPLKRLASDAPRPLQALALTQVPGQYKGPAMRGAYVRGWVDGVRLRKVGDNPYAIHGTGWQQPMRVTYVEGWRAGKQVARLERESDGMSATRYEVLKLVAERAAQIQKGELASSTAATRAVRRRSR